MRVEYKDTFDEISPVTGELAVLIEDNHRIDFSSGYQNLKDSWTTSNEDLITEVESQLPSYIINKRFIDETNNIWYLIIASNEKSMLYPVIENDLYWAVSKVERVTNKEDINETYTFPLLVEVKGKSELVLHKLVGDPTHFSANNFSEAFDLYNSLKIE
jgi:hypothetical protein